MQIEGVSLSCKMILQSLYSYQSPRELRRCEALFCTRWNYEMIFYKLIIFTEFESYKGPSVIL